MNLPFGLPNVSVQAFLAVAFTLTTIVSWFVILAVSAADPDRPQLSIPAELTAINAIVVGYYFGKRSGPDPEPLPAPISG